MLNMFVLVLHAVLLWLFRKSLLTAEQEGCYSCPPTPCLLQSSSSFPSAVQLCCVRSTRDENVSLSHWNADGQRCCTALSASAVYFTVFLLLRQGLALRSSKKNYFLSLFSFSGFALFHFIWLKKDQGYLGLGGELAPELLKSWLVPGIAGTPDGAVGGYLLFFCWNVG